MPVPPLPKELDVASWERQAGAAAKAKPTTVSDALRGLHKALDAIDASAFDAAEVREAARLAEAGKRADAEADRRVKPAVAQARAAAAAARKLGGGLDRKAADAKAVAAAVAALARAADDYASALEGFVRSAAQSFDARAKELQEEERKAAAARPKPSPERQRLRTRLIDRFRICKMHPEQPNKFLLCVGNRSAVAWLGPSVSDSNKPLLARALKGDTNFKFYRGDLRWEDGAYTFVGARMTSTLARRIERGVQELTGTRYRIRAHD